jgi:tetratricopeptide (TPR) repeat protein
MLVCLVSAQIGLGRLAEGRQMATRAIDLLTGEKLRPTTDLSAAQELLGRIALEEGDEQAAVDLLRQALATQEEVRPLDIPAVALRAIELAELLEYQGEAEEATALLQASLERAEATLGELHSITARCLSKLGQCQSHRGMHVDALRNLERSLQIQQALSGHDDEAVIDNLKLLASAAQAAEDFEGSASYYQRALNIRERQLGGQTGDSVEILMSLAGVESEMGHFGRAAERLQQAISKAEVDRMGNLPRALEKLAVVYMLSGRLTDAGVSLGRARQLYNTDPGQYRLEIAANEEIHSQLRSYYHVETTVPEAPKASQVIIPLEAAMPAPTEAERHAPQFEIFEEEARPSRNAMATRPHPDTNAIGILANLLSKEHALSGDTGKPHMWIPAQEWERVLAALRTFEPTPGSTVPAKSETPNLKGPLPLCGWEDLGFEYLHA